jgi:hypothetical protein
MEVNESHKKSLEVNHKSSIGLITKADVRTADSMEADKIVISEKIYIHVVTG